MSRGVRLVNTRTGKEIIVYGRSVKSAFMKTYNRIKNYLNFNFDNWYCVFMTLGFKEAVSVVPTKERNTLFKAIRRKLEEKDSVFLHLSVNEIQPERSAREGVESINLHTICFYTKRGAFPLAKELQEHWPLGILDLRIPQKGQTSDGFAKYLTKYLGKYMGQGLVGSRQRYSPSRVPDVYNLDLEVLKAVAVFYPIEILEKYAFIEGSKLCCYLKDDKEGFIKEVITEWTPEWKRPII